MSTRKQVFDKRKEVIMGSKYWMWMNGNQVCVYFCEYSHQWRSVKNNKGGWK